MGKLVKKAVKSIAQILDQEFGVTLLEDNEQYTNRMEIHSETSDKTYIVAQRKSNGDWSCGCPAWIFRRKCKHLTAMMPVLNQVKTKLLK